MSTEAGRTSEVRLGQADLRTAVQQRDQRIGKDATRYRVFRRLVDAQPSRAIAVALDIGAHLVAGRQDPRFLQRAPYRCLLGRDQLEDDEGARHRRTR